MSYVAVTLEYGSTVVDVALPLHVPSQVLVDGLIESLNLPTGPGRTYFLGVKTVQGLRRIPVTASLGDMMILHGMTLSLREEEKAKPVDKNASLRAEDGTHFSLIAKLVIIGRNDLKSGISVDIDLGSLTVDAKIISRKHAQIEKEGSAFYITDLGSANGTKVNGQRLTAREKKMLKDGDTLEFGRHGIQLVFRTGEG
jgi:hypothetical protein